MTDVEVAGQVSARPGQRSETARGVLTCWLMLSIVPVACTYPDGRVYRLARGRFAPREKLEDALASSEAVVDLDREKLTADEWLQRILREMRIRFYLPKSVKAYRNALTGLMRWFGGLPHELTR
jgi:hypothetical protein